jgi:pSer/pThr/pTyr-binding forkhead associated (FHA) protein
VGRNPVDATGMHRLLGIPDLSRTISRSHALLEPEGSTLWVTDLGSANGTAIAAAGQVFEYLPPGVRVAAPVGARLALGERVMRVADSRRTEVAA